MTIKAIASFIALLLAVNSWAWQEQSLGFGLGITWLVITAWLLSGRLADILTYKSERIACGLVIILILASLVSTMAFYLNLFRNSYIFILIALLPWLGKNTKESHIKNVANKLVVVKLINWYWRILYILIASKTWLIILASSTQEAIRSPWQVISPKIFLMFAITAALAIIIALQSSNFLWLIPLYLIFLGVLGLIYPLGYGFDPFIHQVSEKILLETGTILPKPFYYIGQYTMVVFLATVLRLPINLIDIWLVPIIASLLIPLMVVLLTRRFINSGSWSLALALVPTIFSLTTFTYTTPQSLAYLWVLTTIFLLVIQILGARIPVIYMWLTGAASLVTHPLAGLPIIGLLFAKTIKDYGKNLKYKRLLYWLGGIFSALIVPISFAIFSWLKPSAASIILTSDIIGNIKKIGLDVFNQLPFWPRFIDLPDIVYIWGRPAGLFFIILALIGYWVAKEKMAGLRWLGWAAIWPTVGYLLLSLLTEFPNLPPNEQNFYSIRLWDLALLMLWPLAIWGVYQILKLLLIKINHPSNIILLSSLLLTVSFYLNYPRFDIWQRHTAYNTTYYDVAAVKLIEKMAEGAPYVVLANQAVSAAAIREFGFAKYFDGNFYYPLPTGTNPLYQIYLNAAERNLPKREIIKPAAPPGVPQVFLVLNRYWANYENLKKIAMKEADAWWEIGQGRITVYRYDF